MSEHFIPEAAESDEHRRRSGTPGGSGPTPSANDVIQLQQTIGNRAVAGMMADPLLDALRLRRQQLRGLSREMAELEPGSAAARIKEQATGREEAQPQDPRFQEAMTRIATESTAQGMPAKVVRKPGRERAVRKRRHNRMEGALGDALRSKHAHQVGLADATTDEASSSAARKARDTEVSAPLPGRSMGERRLDLETAMGADADRAREHREAEVEAKRGIGEARSARKILDKKNEFARLGLDRLDAIFVALEAQQRGGRWADVVDGLTQVTDEIAKITSYLVALTGANDRILALGQKKVSPKVLFKLRDTELRTFERAVRGARDDAAATVALTALEDRLQQEEDKVNADRAAVQNRQLMTAQGRWPANNKPLAQIATATRATVGASDDERAAVVESLDALKAGGHPWARKWGAYHGNGEGNLPGAAPGLGGYKEYYVRPAGSAVGGTSRTAAGTRRLVVSDTTGAVYYSHNHYGDPNGTILPAFVKITDP